MKKRKRWRGGTGESVEEFLARAELQQELAEVRKDYHEVSEDRIQNLQKKLETIANESKK